MTKAGAYDVAGVVIAKNARSIMINDGTGSAMVFLYASKEADPRLATYSVGDYLEVKETLVDGDYQPNNGFYQFSVKATITKLTETAPAIPEAIALTSSIADGWKSVSKDASAQKIYKWKTTVGELKGFATTNLEGSSMTIEPAYVDSAVFTLTSGSTYDIEAVFAGYNTKYSYAAVMITKAVLAEEGGGGGETSTDKTVGDFVSGTGISKGVLYNVSGILEGKDSTDKYGNAYLSDPASKKSFKIYGCTTTASAFSGTKFTNPSDAVTTLASINNGDLVKMKVVYDEGYFGKAIMGVITDHSTPTATYPVSVKETSNGTVEPSKATATYGEKIALAITPSEGYVVSEVALNTLYGKTVLTDNEGYSFLATCSNEIEVSFVKNAAPSGATTYKMAENATDWGTSYAERTITLDAVAFNFSSGAYNKQKDWTAKLAILGKGPNDITITAPWDMSKVEVVGKVWGKDPSAVSLSYFVDETETKDTSASASFEADTSVTNEDFDVSTSATFSSKKAKLSLTGTDARVGIEKILITF